MEQETIQDGVYDISIEKYHNGPGISRSTLMEFMKSPLHYNYKVHNREEKKPVDIIRKFNPLEFGNALHTFVLEPELFFDKYEILPEIDKRTTAGKALFKEIQERAVGKEFIAQDAFDEIELMRDSIMTNEDARSLIEGALYEKSLYWTDPLTGLLCKVRPDIWHSNMIVDLKTTASASLRDFQRSVYGYGYHVQAAMIHEALKYVRSEIVTNFLYIAIEKEAPYAVAVYQLDEEAIKLGIRQFQDILLGIKKCQENDSWPSYQAAIITIPNWAQQN